MNFRSHVMVYVLIVNCEYVTNLQASSKFIPNLCKIYHFISSYCLNMNVMHYLLLCVNNTNIHLHLCLNNTNKHMTFMFK